MPTDTIPSFAKSFQDAQGYASHAARQLKYSRHDYQVDTVNVIQRNRREVTLGTPTTEVNFVMNTFKTQESIGWHLRTKQSDEDEEVKWFFLSRTGKITVIWEGMSMYATQITMNTMPTALVLLTDKEMYDIAAELKQIARK